MLKILNHGDDKYDLEDSSGMKIGWISGRSIGFRGFATEADAREAAVAAWWAFDRVLRQHCAEWPLYEPAVDRIRTVHDGAYEWFYDGTAPIARLLRPQRRAYDSSFGVELVLPSSASDDLAIVAARSMAFSIGPYRDGLASSLETDTPTLGTNASMQPVDRATSQSFGESIQSLGGTMK
ncbi:MAG: hypothetical protein ACREPM_17915 [Gemmatimonadaceae bacterium]